MPQTTITFRTDSEVKENFDSFCAAVGMNASVAFNMFMRATIAEQALPFQVRLRAAVPDRINADLMTREEIIAKLEASRKEIEAGNCRDLEDVISDLEERYRL